MLEGPDPDEEVLGLMRKKTQKWLPHVCRGKMYMRPRPLSLFRYLSPVLSHNGSPNQIMALSAVLHFSLAMTFLGSGFACETKIDPHSPTDN